MFKVLSMLVWTVCAVGFGIFLAQFEIDGRTPLEHGQRAWKRKVNPSKLDQLKDGLRDTIGDAKTHGSYSDDERDAIDRIIASGKAK